MPVNAIEINRLEDIISQGIVPLGMERVYSSATYVASLNSGNRAHAVKALLLVPDTKYREQLSEIEKVRSAQETIKKTRGRSDDSSRKQIEDSLEIILNSNVPRLAAHHLRKNSDRNIHVLRRIGRKSHIGTLATEIFLEKIINYRADGATAYGPLSARTLEQMVGSAKSYYFRRLAREGSGNELSSRKGAEFLNELISEARFSGSREGRSMLKKEHLEISQEFYDSLPKHLKKTIKRVYTSLEAIKASEKITPATSRVEELALREQLQYHVSVAIRGIGLISSYDVRRNREISLADRFNSSDKFEYVASRQTILHPYSILTGLDVSNSLARDAIKQGISKDYHCNHVVRSYSVKSIEMVPIPEKEKEQMKARFSHLPQEEIARALPSYRQIMRYAVVKTTFDPATSMSTYPAYHAMMNRL